MENKNEEINENNSKQNNDLDRIIQNNISNNEFENNSISKRIQNKIFIEEILKYSEEIND